MEYGVDVIYIKCSYVAMPCLKNEGVGTYGAT